MRSITMLARVWLDQHPEVTSSLSEGLINHSALARKIKPWVEARTGEKVSVEAITMALSRIGKELSAPQRNGPNPLYFVGDVSIQTGLSILVYSTNEYDKLDFSKIKVKDNNYFVATRGIWHSSLIIGSTLAKAGGFSDFAEQQEHGLVSLTIRLSTGHIELPGVCSGILSALSAKGVNFDEVISTHNELTVVIHPEFTQMAIDTLMTGREGG